MAVNGSALDFGDAEKNEVILFAREFDGRRGISLCSDELGWADGVVGADIAAKGLRGLRGIIANRVLSEFIG